MYKFCIFLTLTLSGCMTIGEHNSLMQSYQKRSTNNINKLKRELRIKDNRILNLLLENENKERDAIKAQTRVESLKTKINLLSNEIKIHKNKVIKLIEENEILIDKLDKSKLNNTSQEESKEEVKETSSERIKEGIKICDNKDLGCYAYALVGKNFFRNSLLDKIHFVYGFMSDREIERFRKRILKSFSKNNNFTRCKSISNHYSPGKTIFRPGGFVFWEYGSEENNVYINANFFGSNKILIREKAFWESINEDSKYCVSFSIKSYKYFWRFISSGYSKIVYVKVNKGWISGKNNKVLYRLKSKTLKSLYPVAKNDSTRTKLLDVTKDKW
jgi:hypothetical protein